MELQQPPPTDAAPWQWLVYLAVTIALWALGLAADHGSVVMALPLLAGDTSGRVRP